ncbi:hypothetical protein TNCV_2982091 [Trichonephila clavipes]|nr:hypothetical protein TNCV_2982091 [Trichonephila clavipes]
MLGTTTKSSLVPQAGACRGYVPGISQTLGSLQSWALLQCGGVHCLSRGSSTGYRNVHDLHKMEFLVGRSRNSRIASYFPGTPVDIFNCPAAFTPTAELVGLLLLAFPLLRNLSQVMQKSPRSTSDPFP